MNDKKVIWITGASSGIGRSLALKFAKEGWTVAASARRENLLQELHTENENIHSFPLDVTNTEQCKVVFNNIIKKFNDVEIYIFSAGINDPDSEKSFNLISIKKIMDVNYFGVMNSINSIYKHYNKKKSGQISVISSVAAFRGLPKAGAYCASKSALTAFMETLNFEMRKINVKVSIINPGFIKTAMTDKNDFWMPMLRPSKFAAEKIYIGLIKDDTFEINFPKPFTTFMKFLGILPYKIYFKIYETMYKILKVRGY